LALALDPRSDAARHRPRGQQRDERSGDELGADPPAAREPDARERPIREQQPGPQQPRREHAGDHHLQQIAALRGRHRLVETPSGQ
jgi:hypothetical protein